MDANRLRTQLEQLLQLTCEKAAQVGEAAVTGAAKAGQTAEDAVTYTQLRLHNRELEAQVAQRLQQVGEVVYATHSGKPRDSAELEQLLREVDGLRRVIAENEAAMALLRGGRRCAACGAVGGAEDRFCQQCGREF